MAGSMALAACDGAPAPVLSGAVQDGASSADDLSGSEAGAVDTAGSSTAATDVATNSDTASDTASGMGADALSDTAQDAGSPGGPCTSNANCPPAAKVCDPLTSQCAACLFDGDCGANQHCLGKSCISFTTCTNSLGCTAAKAPNGEAQGICNAAVSECVACLLDTDCSASQLCQDHHCVDVKKCTNSTNCPPDQVCDPKVGLCFVCAADADCPAGHLCEDHQCRAFTTCVSDKQCTPLGLLCDTAKGKCARCLKNDDCPEVYHCSPSGVGGTGSCELDVCQPGKGNCSPAGKVICTAAGDGFLPPQACAPSTTCVVQAGVPTCAAWVCQPGVHCAGSSLLDCSADGLTLQKTTDCAASGQKCFGDACKTTLCDPGKPYCQDSAVLQCSADGMTSNQVKLCSVSEFCQGGVCQPQVCPPNKPVCVGNAVRLCNANGSALTGTPQDCGSQFCVAGACATLVCAPGKPYCSGKQVLNCSADGLSSTPGALCTADQACESGQCKKVICSPGLPICKGNAVANCSANGTAYSELGSNCSAAGQSCKGGACVKASCGDGVVNGPTEQCDDGNSVAGDGCSATCQLETSAPGTAPLPLADGATCSSVCPAPPSCALDDGCGKPCPLCASSTGKTNTCQAGVCAACTPSCAPGQCGSNGCGGWCAPCSGTNSCNGSACVAACSLCPAGGCTVLNFDNGLVGWDVTSDANVVQSLGKTIAPSGSGMLRLSTGLATNTSSSARTALCVPAGATKIRFKWRFFSEELMEYCASQFQDTFTMSLQFAAVPKTVFAVKVDDICNNVLYNKGLTPADVKFDQGGVYMTTWLETTVAVPDLATATAMTLAVSDVGDSIYDTVVLIDDIAFIP